MADQLPSSLRTPIFLLYSHTAKSSHTIISVYVEDTVPLVTDLLYPSSASESFKPLYITDNTPKGPMGISRPSSSSRRICDMSVRCWASLVPLLLLVAQFAVASELEIRHNTSALESTPMRIRNNCAETIWPALLTQAGKALMGDFGLKSGSFKETIISEDGQRRVWGRINCSFNSNGTGSTNGPPWARETGDCNGTLGCIGTVCYI